MVVFYLKDKPTASFHVQEEHQSMSLLIEKATLSDVKDILEIYAPYITDTCITFEYDVPSLEEFTRRFESISADYPYFVARLDGKTVGYAYASRAFERAAYNWDADLSVYLTPCARGKGIGKRLVEAVEKELVQMGYRNIYSIITGDNTDSCAFHEALGYTKAGTLHKSGFKHGKWLDVFFYEKRIGDYTTPTPITKIQ